MQELPRNDKGELSSHAWPGCYPLYYLDSDNLILCPTCANKDGYTEPIVAYDVNWEDPTLTCDDCNQTIESAYGEEE